MATIMTVDDSVISRSVIATILKEVGHTVIITEGPVEALKTLLVTTVDLIITDLHMPHMDGIELTKNLRADNSLKLIPILILTAETEKSDRLRGKAAGASGWVIKPFAPAQLIKAVSHLLLNHVVADTKISVQW